MLQDRLVLHYHRPQRPVKSAHIGHFPLFPNKPQHNVLLSHFRWAVTRHISPIPSNALGSLLCDVQGPSANVSPACNNPQCPYAVWEEWKGLTSFWPSAALRFLSRHSPSAASPISSYSLRGLSVLVSPCVFVSSMCMRSLLCNVCIFVCVSVATFPSSNILFFFVFSYWRMSPFSSANPSADCTSYLNSRENTEELS